MVGDLGDSLTGGAENDDFVAVVGPAGSVPVEITDLAPESEVLQLLLDGPATGLVADLDRADGLGADVQLDGQVVAVLRGLTAAAVAPDSIVLTYMLAS